MGRAAGMLARAWAGARARLAPRPAAPDAQGVLCVSVSELGWQATLLHSDDPAPQESADRGADGDAPVSPVEALRRAVRTISAAQRERIGSVRLLVDDPQICLADSRSTRIKSTDPVMIRQAGAQELGTKGALYAVQPFGRSSEHEVARGAYAFLSTDRAQDYLGALDSLAVKLVEIVPAGLLRLADAEGPPFAALDVRAASTALLLADPETGAVLSREVAYGARSFVAAVAEATSVSAKDAAEGLQRRACFRADAGADGAATPLTATERAVTPILAAFRAELLASVEYFQFQRLAGAPERLAVTGDADRVRGLAEWIGGAMDLSPEAGEGLHARFAAACPAPSLNLLESAPKGLLKVGKAEYRFVEGRFRADQAQPARPGRPASGWAAAPISAASVREALAGLGVRRAALPAAAGLGLAVALWATVSGADAALDGANAVLAARAAEDAVLRTALVRRTGPPDEAGASALYWTDKLTALAGAMPEGLHLVKLSTLGTEKPARDDRLVLEGEAAAGADPLARIANFIERLSADTAFMHDVAAITLDGTAAAENQGRGAVRFTITVALGKSARAEAGTAPRRGAGG
jgi:hypothetical protein